MTYKVMRDVGEGWQVWESLIGFSSSTYRITSGNGQHVVIDGVSLGWHHLVPHLTVSDMIAALYVTESGPNKGERLKSMQRIIEHGVRERHWAYQSGMMDGTARASRERKAAASVEFRLLKDAAAKIMKTTAADSECPWLVGIIRGTARRAAKSVFLYPWHYDKATHRDVVAAVEALGIPMTGQRDGLCRHKSHCLVLAPTATAGTDHYTNSISLRQDEFTATLRLAGITRDEVGNLVFARQDEDVLS